MSRTQQTPRGEHKCNNNNNVRGIRHKTDIASLPQLGSRLLLPTTTPLFHLSSSVQQKIVLKVLKQQSALDFIARWQICILDGKKTILICGT